MKLKGLRLCEIPDLGISDVLVHLEGIVQPRDRLIPVDLTRKLKSLQRTPRRIQPLNPEERKDFDALTRYGLLDRYDNGYELSESAQRVLYDCD